MKIHRFFCGVGGGKIADDEVLAQMQRVLKLKNGEQVILMKGDGMELLVEISNIKTGEVKVLKERKNENEPAKHVILYCAVLKRENFELVAQKATEIGVKEIVPLITKRTVKLNLNMDRLMKIVKEAVEQSGRSVLPFLHKPKHFEEAVKHATGLNIFADVDGGDAPASTATAARLGIWIGPEGGWDESELRAAKQAGFSIAKLGKLTYRAETAAIVASYLAVGM